MPTKENIVMPVTILTTLRMPAENAAYLLYYPIYIIKCTSRTSNMY